MRSEVPFVWALDHETRLCRLAVSRPLALACRDRLGYWRTLQELAGIRSEHARRAAEAARAEARAEAREEIARLRSEAAAELERTRRDAAREVVNRLTASLLEVDVATFAAPDAPTAAAAETTTPGPEPAAPAADEDEGIEPYIDTELCTTCNECTDMNPKMFAYDENKQAYIQDPRAGTFKQLVKAAAKCTARIIHPGTPLDPDESDLEKWVQLAEPFN